MLSTKLRTLAALAMGFVLTTLPNFQSVASAQTTQQAQPKDAAQLVVSSQTDNTHVTVYPNYAQIEQTRVLKLKRGQTYRVQLTGVASKYRKSTFWLYSFDGPGQFDYASADYTGANLNNKSLVESNIGHEVTAWRYDGDKLRPVTGKLLSVDGTVLSLDIGNGKTDIVNTSNVTVTTPSGLSNTASLVLDNVTVSADGEYSLHILYETDGFGWDAHHFVNLNEKTLQADWQTFITVTNDCGTALPNCRLHLMSVPQQAANVRMYAVASSRDGAPGAAAPPARVESLNDQRSFTIPQNVSLKRGVNRQINLLQAHNVALKRNYIAGRNTYYGNVTQKQRALIQLTVDNCAKNNFGKDLPAGAVTVFQKASEGNLQKSGGAVMGEHVNNEVFDLVIGSSGDVKWQIVDRGVRKVGPKEQDHTLAVEIENYKDNDAVSVHVELAIASDQQLEPHWKRNVPDKAETDVTVEAKKSNAVSYTVREKTSE